MSKQVRPDDDADFQKLVSDAVNQGFDSPSDERTLVDPTLSNSIKHLRQTMFETLEPNKLKQQTQFRGIVLMQLNSITVGQQERIRLKVRIPQIHNFLPVPSSHEDYLTISLYPTFHGDPKDLNITEEISVGTEVEVAFANQKNLNEARVIRVVGVPDGTAPTSSPSTSAPAPSPSRSARRPARRAGTRPNYGRPRPVPAPKPVPVSPSTPFLPPGPSQIPLPAAPTPLPQPPTNLPLGPGQIPLPAAPPTYTKIVKSNSSQSMKKIKMKPFKTDRYKPNAVSEIKSSYKPAPGTIVVAGEVQNPPLIAAPTGGFPTANVGAPWLKLRGDAMWYLAKALNEIHAKGGLCPINNTIRSHKFGVLSPSAYGFSVHCTGAALDLEVNAGLQYGRREPGSPNTERHKNIPFLLVPKSKNRIEIFCQVLDKNPTSAFLRKANLEGKELNTKTPNRNVAVRTLSVIVGDFSKFTGRGKKKKGRRMKLRTEEWTGECFSLTEVLKAYGWRGINNVLQATGYQNWEHLINHERRMLTNIKSERGIGSRSGKPSNPGGTPYGGTEWWHFNWGIAYNQYKKDNNRRITYYEALENAGKDPDQLSRKFKQKVDSFAEEQAMLQDMTRLTIGNQPQQTYGAKQIFLNSTRGRDLRAKYDRVDVLKVVTNYRKATRSRPERKATKIRYVLVKVWYGSHAKRYKWNQWSSPGPFGPAGNFTKSRS